MKLIATVIASVFAISAFAQAPAAKKEEKKADAKPVVTAPATNIVPATPATNIVPATPAKSDAKAAPAKKDDKKPADATPAKK